jgi:hypothetical protein
MTEINSIIEPIILNVPSIKISRKKQPKIKPKQKSKQPMINSVITRGYTIVIYI